MEESSQILVGIEAGLLKGLDILRWTIDQLNDCAEILSASTVVQSGIGSEHPNLRVVLKLSTSWSAEKVIDELKKIEQRFDETMKVIEPMKCFLMVYDQTVFITPAVTLPHPNMIADTSWLYCAWEVWRSFHHPIMGQTLDRIMNQTNVTNVEFYGQGKTIISKTYL